MRVVIALVALAFIHCQVAFAQDQSSSPSPQAEPAAITLEGADSAESSAEAADATAEGAEDEFAEATSDPGDVELPEDAAADADASGWSVASQGTNTYPAPLQEPTSSIPEPKQFSNGSFTHRVPIDVPEFYGIEPTLAIVYNSNARLRYNGLTKGLLGVGSRLAGIPVIERARPRRGVPRFNTNDIYMLNGQEMIACADIAPSRSSPSCQNGGTHATRVESYQRIRRFGHSNPAFVAWEITRRDGVVLRFESAGRVYSAQPEVIDGTLPRINLNNDNQRRLGYEYRWLLTSVTDLYGNTVEYEYFCRQFVFCVPIEISYNPRVATPDSKLYRIIIRYQSRQNNFSYGTGVARLIVNRRISAISILVDGQVRSS